MEKIIERQKAIQNFKMYKGLIIDATVRIVTSEDPEYISEQKKKIDLWIDELKKIYIKFPSIMLDI